MSDIHLSGYTILNIEVAIFVGSLLDTAASEKHKQTLDRFKGKKIRVHHSFAVHLPGLRIAVEGAESRLCKEPGEKTDPIRQRPEGMNHPPGRLKGNGNFLSECLS